MPVPTVVYGLPEYSPMQTVNLSKTSQTKRRAGGEQGTGYLPTAYRRSNMTQKTYKATYYVIRVDGRKVASFGSALRDMAETELQKWAERCFGTQSKVTLTEEVS